VTTPESVLIVGTGLVGTSLGLALRRRGVAVYLADVDPEAVAAAESLGAGIRADPSRPPGSVRLAVVAVPPAATGQVVVDLLAANAAEFVTDVASVKVLPHRVVREQARDPQCYIGGHPMAGREVSGPKGALPDLFEGRPWVVCPDATTSAAGVEVVESMVREVGATPVRLSPAEHDVAVALVSHTPHLVASLVAGQLAAAPENQVRLAGPGVTDVTRVASGDPELWTEILIANADAVTEILGAVRGDLDHVLSALERARQSGPSDAGELRDVLARGVTGRSRLPGKHGAERVELAAVQVVVADRPGQLARLFADVGDSGVNVEDVRIEHRLGQPTGVVEVDVRASEHGILAEALRDRGWTVHD
jgi:prephenate dehydrogenase